MWKDEVIAYLRFQYYPNIDLRDREHQEHPQS
jgi:hypothetical protein